MDDKTICPERNCTGCAACAVTCPFSAIEMRFDALGFRRPFVIAERCRNCGRCLQHCPANNGDAWENREIRQCFRSHAVEREIRARGPSGGVWGALAKTFVQHGGCVAGAVFLKDRTVRHQIVDNVDAIESLQKTKYIQSDCQHAYGQIRDLLARGRKVLFSGTPCQVAGLYAFLGGKSKGLFTCDLICAGVPSPGLFSRYVDYVERKTGQKIEFVESRSKERHGWEKPSVILRQHGVNRVLRQGTALASYFWGFRNGLTFRDSCYECKYATLKRVGDLTLGDFWVLPSKRRRCWNEDDRRFGESVVFVNSECGRELWNDARDALVSREVDFELATQRQPHLFKSHVCPETRVGFARDVAVKPYEELAEKYLVESRIHWILRTGLDIVRTIAYGRF